MTAITATEAADLIATAHELADAARVATLQHFRSAGLTADNKEVARFDPVTVADRLSEERMRAILVKVGTLRPIKSGRRSTCNGVSYFSTKDDWFSIS